MVRGERKGEGKVAGVFMCLFCSFRYLRSFVMTMGNGMVKVRSVRGEWFYEKPLK